MELGSGIDISDARFVGVYQHLYDDSAVGESITTHYVVLAYEVTLVDTSNLPFEQHIDYRWLEPEVILNDSSVHENSQAYFIFDSVLNFSVWSFYSPQRTQSRFATQRKHFSFF